MVLQSNSRIAVRHSTPCFTWSFPWQTTTTTAASSNTTTRRVKCCTRCGGEKGEAITSRRNLLRVGAMALIGTMARGSVDAEEAVCRNCVGCGQVACELCKGTGFWRALSGNDENLRYKGVVCPECEGSGKLTCPVCLGTGEGNVRGLLRRRTVPAGPGRVLQSK